MALDSISHGPMFLGYPEYFWLHRQEKILNSFLPPKDAFQPKFNGWSNRRDAKGKRSPYESRMDQNPGLTTSMAGNDREARNGHFTMRPSIYDSKEKSSADVKMTSLMTKNDQFQWKPIEYQSKDHFQTPADVRMISAMANTYDNYGDVNMTHSLTSIRERSQSTGSWRSLGISRASSGSSAVSAAFSGDEFSTSGRGQIFETPLETMRRDLMRLWACRSDDTRGEWNSDIKNEDNRSASLPESLSSLTGSEGASWQDSKAEQNLQLKARLHQARQRYDDLPIDMTCRKRKTRALNPVSNGDLASTLSPSQKLRDGADTARNELDCCNESSILRSMLTERGRCYSMSILEMRRRRLAKQTDSASSDVNRSETGMTQLTDRQRVTLAKKNLLPVTARITDLLGRVVDFAKSQGEFSRLPMADQEILLSSSCLRLLLLFMAETNLQFATTVVTGEGTISSGGGEYQLAAAAGVAARDTEVPKAPTKQFVCSVQNFIRKCQTLNVTSKEYFRMKLITLFHSGIGSMECTRLANRMNSVARQDLQDLVTRSHPSERLRYSTLLLSLHTLFGIHCGMLRSLFCQHLDRNGGVRTFVTDALSTSKIECPENANQ